MQNEPKQLLLVDDSVLVIKRVALTLYDKLTNTNIISVLKGADAVTAIDKFKPTVVLLDINLPDISGIELLKQIRVGYPAIKVIMLTNQSKAHIRKICLQQGAEGFYDKTREFEKAIEHIKKLNQ